MKAQNKKKQKLIYSLSTAIAVTGFMLLMPQHTNKTVTKIELKKTKNKASRSIASIPSTTMNSAISKKHSSSHTDLKREIKEWEKKFKFHFTKNLTPGEIKDFTIKPLGNIVYKKNKSSRDLEHIIVSFKKNNGNKYSFEAYIDPKTGMMFKSWNQTRYEFRKEALLDPKGKAYSD